MRLKKWGVTASASLFPDKITPARSSRVSANFCSSCCRLVTRFLSCHFQSFQSSGATFGQKPGANERNRLSAVFAKLFLFCVLVDSIFILHFLFFLFLVGLAFMSIVPWPESLCDAPVANASSVLILS